MSERAGPLRRLTGDALVYGLGHVAQQVLGLIFVPVFTRYLAVGDYGVLSATNVLFFLVAALLPLGLGQAAIRLVFDTDDREEQRRRIGTGLTACMTTTLLATPVLLLTAPALGRGLFGDDEQTAVLRLAFLALPGATLRTYALGVLRARFRKWAFGLVSVTSVVLLAAFNVVTVVVLGMGVEGIFLGGAISLTAVGLLAGWLIRGEIVPGLAGDRLRSLLAYGIPLVPASLAFWALSYVDRLLLTRLLGTDAVGLYEVGSKVAAVVAFATTAVYQAFVPLSFEMSRDDESDRGYGRILVAYLLGMGGLSLVLVAFGREIVEVLAAADYRAGAAVVPWLVPGVAISGLGTILATGIHLARKTIWITAAAGAAAAANVVLNLWWIPEHGIVGAAAATLVSYAVMVVLLLAAAQRLHPIAYPWGRAAVAAAMAGGAIVAASHVETVAVRAGVVVAYLAGAILLRPRQ
jgi:O-antigen/teichoic acid export membrane protein